MAAQPGLLREKDVLPTIDLDDAAFVYEAGSAEATKAA
jgi:hypothetical protein